jgi:U3 small nucleolar RNA-associated protein 7
MKETKQKRHELIQQNRKGVNQYLRDRSTIPIKSIRDKKLKTKLRKIDLKQKQVALEAFQSEMLLLEEEGALEGEGLERTWKFTQNSIKDHVDINTEKKMFDLKLTDFGGYNLDYTRNGRWLLIGGRKGHVGAFDWQTGELATELHLRETVKDVTWLHNETMFAVAQKKYTYIYDKTGMEMHVLRDHIEANRLEFLPYHFLLASVGNAGFLKYQDTSTGQMVAEHRTKLGKCNAMTQNPFNSIIHLGHANGTVTLWSPSMTQPLVKMLCHSGPVQSLSIDQSGHYMATAGLDGQLKLWDIRTYKELNAYFTPTPAATVTFSQKGLLAVGSGPRVTIWKDVFKTKQKEPYMTHLIEGSAVQDLKYCPFEDVLGVGHRNGFSSLVVPGQNH